MNKLVFFSVLLLFLQSCQTDVVFNKYQTLENAHWEHDNLLTFEMEIKDTLNHHNLFINIRNTKDYEYNNLFLITQMTFPDLTKVVDTLEYEMTDATGHFLGSGFSDTKENKLFYKENVRFKESGIYLFQIRQAMRKRNEVVGISPLQGISDVGISIEKVK